jgi:hypothetical protein
MRRHEVILLRLHPACGREHGFARSIKRDVVKKERNIAVVASAAERGFVRSNSP